MVDAPRMEGIRPTIQNTEPPIRYLAMRYLEIICVAIFIFGFLWNGTEVLNLTTPQFLMLYGGMGAVICEILARIFSKKKITN